MPMLSSWTHREAEAVKHLWIQLSVLNPKRIVYVSCNPQTLARDLKYLAKKGYHTKQATPVDMFPWTKAEHVETVCLLEKGKK